MKNAYCYRSGHIGFCVGAIPSGALPIRLGVSDQETETIRARARLAYDNKTLLVPGIPEAEDDNAAYQAFERFIKWLDFPPHPSRGRRRSKVS